MYSSDYFTAQSIQNKVKGNQQQYTLLSPYPETIVYYYKNSRNISLISVEKIKKLSTSNNLANSIAEYEKNTNRNIIIPHNNLLDWGISGNYDNSLRKWYESIGLYELRDFIYSSDSCLWYEEKWPDYVEGQYIYLKFYLPCSGHREQAV